MQTTSNSTHSPNIFIGNENTPHICSQIHISACVCISVRYKVSQTVQLTAGVKNLTHTPKKKIRPLSTARTPPICTLASKKHHTYARKHILMHINAFPSTTKVPANTLNGPKKFGPFSAKNLTRNASYGPDDFFTSKSYEYSYCMVGTLRRARRKVLFYLVVIRCILLFPSLFTTGSSYPASIIWLYGICNISYTYIYVQVCCILWCVCVCVCVW